MSIDNVPIRKKAKKEYEKVLRDMEKAKTEIERFQAEDLPHFRRWMNATFGVLMTDIRELHHKVMEAQSLINEVQQEYYYGRHRSIYHAYQRVKKLRANPEPPPGTEEEFNETEEEKEFRKEQDDFRSFVEDLLSDEDDDDGFEEVFGKGPQGSRLREEKLSAEERHRATRIKDLYRALVRRLHPDQAKDLTPKHIEWWHQTQAAYEAGNIEQLELIFTLTEIEKGGTKEASISILKRITYQFKLSLKGLKTELKKFQSDPAWNFSKLTDYSSIFRKIRHDLDEEHARMSWLLKRCQDQINQWERLAGPMGKQMRGSKKIWREEELF